MQLFKNQAGISDIFSKDVTFRDIFSQPLRMKKTQLHFSWKVICFQQLKVMAFYLK